ncbi:hypothetical protein ACQVP2_18065 [Methylobacterium aquaticum]|jgi:hypothetical protein|uniref:Uncharacterized protein n=1 Tax=Methylobacterium aquaticum TaxID=270351 RepID=A0A0J6SZC5_9HYPH|nr:hypothetical protein [Methylobacterium aquaticum]KMO38683.1 hypothetical protein VP06_05780 [Methylobacterium aquaticum]
MRAIVLGTAATLATAFSLAPAAALPVAPSHHVAPVASIEQAQYVTRRVVRRGPRCVVKVTRTRGPFGRVVVRKVRRCV